MICVRRLFESNYGNITFNMELKIPAAWTLASWKKAGLGEMYESAISDLTQKNIAICILVLSTISANFSDKYAAPFCDENLLRTLKCVFHAIVTTDSTRKLPPIPAESYR